MPREHDAVFLRSIIATRLVVRSLESAHFAGVCVSREQRVLMPLFILKKLVHLGFRAALGAKLTPLALDRVLVIFKFFFVPGSGQGSSRIDQIAPLQLFGVEQGSHIGFP